MHDGDMVYLLISEFVGNLPISQDQDAATNRDQLIDVRPRHDYR
jgi:hypothetical protein